jgi:hypothetical protein
MARAGEDRLTQTIGSSFLPVAGHLLSWHDPSISLIAPFFWGGDVCCVESRALHHLRLVPFGLAIAVFVCGVTSDGPTS